ncbi:MAG: PrsW family intramembrane metalloprotease [Planctomycetes bacterium]|nr:PrsW family intramembrane metalloprotease [Planctomycetota bacterium]
MPDDPTVGGAEPSGSEPAGANPAPAKPPCKRASRIGAAARDAARRALGAGSLAVRATASTGRAFWRNVAALAWSFLSPRQIFAVLRHSTFWITLLAAAAPILVVLMRWDLNAMIVYFSLVWAYVFYRLFDLHRNLLHQCAFFYAFSVLVSWPAFIGWLNLPPHWVDAWIQDERPAVRLFAYVCGVGLREEVTKGLGLLLAVLLRNGLRRRFPSWGQITALEGMMYCVMGGLGFAAMENIGWMQDIIELTNRHEIEGGAFKSSLGRIVLNPFVHACWTGAMGYFVVRASREPSRRTALLAAAVLLPCALHGAYDFCVSTAGFEVLALAWVGATFYLYLACQLKLQGEVRLNELDRRLTRS